MLIETRRGQDLGWHPHMNLKPTTAVQRNLMNTTARFRVSQFQEIEGQSNAVLSTDFGIVPQGAFQVSNAAIRFWPKESEN